MLQAKELAEIINDIVWECDVTTLEAVIIFCERNEVDPETVAGVISSSQTLKDAIYRDAEDLRLVERINRIPE